MTPLNLSGLNGQKIENKKIFVQKDKIALPLTFPPSFPTSSLFNQHKLFFEREQEGLEPLAPYW
jgi:hypothetical protein